MIVLQMLSAMLLAQATPPAMMESTEASPTQRDAAYEELVSGDTDAAISRLEAGLVDNPDDPALLINLGSAWAARGDKDRAAQYYRAAARSDVRYRLELANGDWVDSRTAARLALRALGQTGFAMN